MGQNIQITNNFLNFLEITENYIKKENKLVYWNGKINNTDTIKKILTQLKSYGIFQITDIP